MPSGLSPKLIYGNGSASAEDSSVTIDGGNDKIIFHDGNFLKFHDGNLVVFHHPVNPEQASASAGTAKNISPRLTYSGEAEL